MSSRLLVIALFVSTTALAQGAAGVSDERVSLPGAPGSLDGLGSNAESEGNQGALTYQVKIEVPQGFAGVTPDLALSYSSSSGSGLLGAGWDLDSFSIERMTSKGLQQYGVDDRFVGGSSSELLRVAQTADSATYRARFEGGFIRYTWRDRGTGENGWWLAELPDGRKAYYGADASGAAVPTAQVQVPGSAPARVFRWHLVLMVDPHGNELRFNWTKTAGGYPLLERVDYVFEAGTPRHSVRFTYEARNDRLSDARPGFELLLDQRLRDVRVLSGAEVIRAYVMTYEAESASDGATRLSRVTRFGRNNAQYPIAFSFAYTQTLGGSCGTGCDKPFVRDMGTIAGVDFSTGRATLVDINGDALPDVLVSDVNGQHRFHYARLDSEGRTSFSMTPVMSQKTLSGSAFLIGDPRTQLLDLDGNGFVDLAQATTSSVLCNDGSGDWVDAAACTGGTINMPASAMADDTDTTQADPRYIRFFDYDADRRIDWLRTFSGSTATEVLANTPTGFQTVAVSNIGATFDEDALQLADMNGDGLQDPVQLIVAGTAVQAQYRLNYGRGEWSAWKTITLSGLDATQAASAELQDVNGDGLADVVAVTGSEVRLALNRNGERFDPVRVLTTADLATGSTMPTRVTGTTVVFADMNGNGSDDVVWIQQNGKVEYLELFPVRPNLITRIDNGVGGVQLVTYGSSISEQARDTAAAAPWRNRVPHAAIVVKSITSYVTLTGTESSGLRELTSMDYHSGFYDGVEKQFRGYEQVVRTLAADMSRDAQEPGVIETDFDVGKMDPALAGVPLVRRVFSTVPGTRVLLSESRNLYSACPVAGSSNSKFACLRAITTVQVERTPAEAVTTRTELDWDGYGNTIARRELGVVNLGTPEAPMPCGACSASGVFGAPCGAMCTGDELYEATEYVVPGADTADAWLVNLATRATKSAVASMTGDETLTFYDGPDFMGLPQGRATRGLVTRVMSRVGPGANDFVADTRARFDPKGQLAELVTPLGAPGGAGRHVYTYDASGLNLTRVEMTLGGAVSSLRKDVVYDTAWELLSQSSNWYPVVNGTAAQAPQLTRFRWDDHGRLARIIEPGDSDASPSQEFRYALGAPSSRIEVLERSTAAGPQDLVTARCFDGRGRVYQVRNQLSSGRWQVSGFTEFDARGAAVRRYHPWVSTSAACDAAPPSGAPFARFTYDPQGRMLTEVEHDGAQRSMVYQPLRLQKLDEHDTDAQASFTATPNIERFDGLGRLVAVQRLEQRLGMGTPAESRYEYDALGNVAVARDALGNLHTQVWSAGGRLMRVTNPNSGTTQLEYDGAGNVSRRVDARNAATRSTYDALNRLLERWNEADRAGTLTTWEWDLSSTACAECTNTGGQLASRTWSGALPGRDLTGYDAKGNVTYSERRTMGAAWVTRRRYDAADRLVSVTWPGGLSQDVRYDGNNRFVAMPGLVESIDYDDKGDPSKVTFTNGTRTEYGYDARRRLTSLKTFGAADAALLDLGYTWSPRGDLLALTDGARAGRARHSGTFGYDAWRRLTSASLGRDGEDEVLTFAYDAIDNITSKTSSLGAQSRAHVGTYTYDAARKNAVTQAGSSTYQYDEAGQLRAKNDVTLTRDAEGHIVSATKGGAPSGTYVWASDDRVAKQESGFTTFYLEGDFEVRDGIGVAYPRLFGERVARLETASLAATLYSDLAPASGSGTQLTVTGDSTIDVADAWLSQAASLSLVSLSGGPAPSPVDDLLRSAARRLLVTDVTWLHGDHLQSQVLATDATGAVRGEQSFYPTGELRSSSGFVDRYGFTGQEVDEGTGLTHFRYRDYDPQSGRWDSVDPAFERVTEEGARSLGQVGVGYAYTGNMMMNANDPTGLGLTARISAKVAQWGKYWSQKKIFGGAKHQAMNRAIGSATSTIGQKAAYAAWKVGQAIKSNPTAALKMLFTVTGFILNAVARSIESDAADKAAADPNTSAQDYLESTETARDLRTTTMVLSGVNLLITARDLYKRTTARPQRGMAALPQAATVAAPDDTKPPKLQRVDTDAMIQREPAPAVAVPRQQAPQPSLEESQQPAYRSEDKR